MDGVSHIVFDTDLWGDIDDMMALAMLHALHDRREIKLAAVTISTQDSSSVAYAHLINEFYGHRIPVGVVSNGISAEQTKQRCASWSFQEINYTQWVCDRRHYYDLDTAAAVSPPAGERDLAAVPLMRRTLAALPDRSVVFVQVGFSSNLAQLLSSEPDEHSDLSGRELVSRKGRYLSMMPGTFGDCMVRKARIAKGAPEFNLYMDVGSAQQLVEHWPTPIVACGTEIAARMHFPSRRVEADFAYVPHHPVADSYRYWKIGAREHGKEIVLEWPHDHHTADLAAVLYAARPDHDYFSTSAAGRIQVLNDGTSEFEETPEGQHSYLTLNDAQAARALEAMVMLVSQPPARLNGSRRELASD
jgi:purine nucleosidase